MTVFIVNTEREAAKVANTNNGEDLGEGCAEDHYIVHVTSLEDFKFLKIKISIDKQVG